MQVALLKEVISSLWYVSCVFTYFLMWYFVSFWDWVEVLIDELTIALAVSGE